MDTATPQRNRMTGGRSKLRKMVPSCTSTPTSSRTRGSAAGGGALDPAAAEATATPPPRRRHSSRTTNREQQQQPEVSMFQCSQQAYNPNPITGVGWNFEESPSVKEKLRQLMATDSDEEELPSPAPLTPAMKLRLRHRPAAAASLMAQSPPKIDQEALDMVEDFRDIAAKIKACREAREEERPPEVALVSTPPPTTKEEDDSPSLLAEEEEGEGGVEPTTGDLKDDLFGDDSIDDSFLVRCTQAAEQEQEAAAAAFKRPSSVTLPDAAKVTAANATLNEESCPTQMMPKVMEFDPLATRSTTVEVKVEKGQEVTSSDNLSIGFESDDEFDMILSQMEIPSAVKMNNSGTSDKQSTTNHSLLPKNEPANHNRLSQQQKQSNLAPTTTTVASNNHNLRQQHKQGNLAAASTNQNLRQQSNLAATSTNQNLRQQSNLAAAAATTAAASANQRPKPVINEPASMQTKLSSSAAAAQLNPAAKPAAAVKLKAPAATAAAPSTSGSSSWRRVYSSPEATTTSGALRPTSVKQRHQTVCGGNVAGGGAVPKCSKDEIERKRLEAIKKRQLSQKLKKGK